MIRPDRPKLPVFAIGAGVVHAIGLAILLPLLITLPGPGADIKQTPVNIEVDVGSPDPPRPVVPDVSSGRAASDETTSALPASPEPDVGADDVSPDTSPDAVQDTEQQAVPSSPKPAPAAAVPAKRAKPKVEAKSAKPAAKVVRAPQPKKSVVARAKPSKPLFWGSSARASVKTPAQGSWTSLFNAPPSAADARQ